MKIDKSKEMNPYAGSTGSGLVYATPGTCPADTFELPRDEGPRGNLLFKLRRYREALPFLESAASKIPSGYRADPTENRLRSKVFECYKMVIKVEGPSEVLLQGASKWLIYASDHDKFMHRLDFFSWKAAGVEFSSYNPLLQILNFYKNVDSDLLSQIISLLPCTFSEDMDAVSSRTMKILLHPLAKRDWEVIENFLLPSFEDEIREKMSVTRSNAARLSRLIWMIKFRLFGRRICYSVFRTCAVFPHAARSASELDGLDSPSRRSFCD